MYEQKLKAQNPSHRNITYDISDLFFFVDLSSVTSVRCDRYDIVATALDHQPLRTTTIDFNYDTLGGHSKPGARAAHHNFNKLA